MQPTFLFSFFLFFFRLAFLLCVGKFGQPAPCFTYYSYYVRIGVIITHRFMQPWYTYVYIMLIGNFSLTLTARLRLLLLCLFENLKYTMSHQLRTRAYGFFLSVLREKYSSPKRRELSALKDADGFTTYSLLDRAVCVYYSNFAISAKGREVSRSRLYAAHE